MALAFVCTAPPAARAQAAPPSPTAPAATPTPDTQTQEVVPASAEHPYTSLWLNQNATLTDDIIAKVVANLRQQEADPQHILLLVHGFDTCRADSTAQFTTMAQRAIEQYKKRGKRVAVVGLQWNSKPPEQNWIVKMLTATLGLDSDNPYLNKVALAENIGRTGGRQLVSALNAQFASSQVDVMAHSLGCDITRNMLTPYLISAIKRSRFVPDETPLFAPEQVLQTGVVALAGADLDYDLLYRNRELTAKSAAGMKLTWLTVGGIKNPDRRDLVLSLRALARGDRAMGNTIPRMSRLQIDRLCRGRRIVFDANDIPMTHDILKYYSVTRVDRVVGAAVAIKDPSIPSPLLTKLDEIIHAPADCKVLQKFFEHNNDLSVSYYTLWRLEGICCGGPRHLSDGYLEWLSRLLIDRPADIARERWSGPCIVVRDGWWPTAHMVDRATEKQFGQAGRPQVNDSPYLFSEGERW